jgi:hypothetical protein
LSFLLQNFGPAAREKDRRIMIETTIINANTDELFIGQVVSSNTINSAVTTNPTIDQFSSVTAEQIKTNCPTVLVVLGEHIAAHLHSAERHDVKADDHRISAGQLLAQAQKWCDRDGFTAFRELFFPDLRKSRVYELLAIASGKKTEAAIRADNAARNREFRSRKKAAERRVRHVTEIRKAVPSLQQSAPQLVEHTAEAELVVVDLRHDVRAGGGDELARGSFDPVQELDLGDLVDNWASVVAEAHAGDRRGLKQALVRLAAAASRAAERIGDAG